MPAQTKSFSAYLKSAVDLALRDEKEQTDNGNLKWIGELARRGVKRNWSDLTPERFLEQYLWCVGSIQKKYWVHEKHFPLQVELFRQCKAADITRDAAKIRDEWAAKRCDLNTRMLNAVIDTAAKVARDWDGFKSEYLLLAENPESELLDDWRSVYAGLDRLPMVGDAIAWYLIRNLYGAPFFKPDVHINAIVRHFFGAGRLHEMSDAVRKLWPTVCRDTRWPAVHLGVADYVLWWYRQSTNDPREISSIEPASTTHA
jgi:hypothetical protein